MSRWDIFAEPKVWVQVFLCLKNAKQALTTGKHTHRIFDNYAKFSRCHRITEASHGNLEYRSMAHHILPRNFGCYVLTWSHTQHALRFFLEKASEIWVPVFRCCYVFYVTRSCHESAPPDNNQSPCSFSYIGIFWSFFCDGGTSFVD